MLGYHGDKAALAQLVASTMPQLAERVGTTGLAESWREGSWRKAIEGAWVELKLDNMKGDEIAGVSMLQDVQFSLGRIF